MGSDPTSAGGRRRGARPRKNTPADRVAPRELIRDPQIEPVYDPYGEESGSDVPNRFDISGYSAGLFGGPGSELLGSYAMDPHSDAAMLPLPEPVPAAPRLVEDLPELHDVPDFPDPVEDDVLDPFEPPSLSMPGFPRSSWDEPGMEGGSLVRPYALTGGRTRPDHDLAIEALVSTNELSRDLDTVLQAEHRAICELCLEVRSVAEVAALLRLPLGVVRVLIGDMAGLGLVKIHQTALVVGDRPSMEFLERVLSGLRRL
jgi:hypothetical protein